MSVESGCTYTSDERGRDCSFDEEDHERPHIHSSLHLVNILAEKSAGCSPERNREVEKKMKRHRDKREKKKTEKQKKDKRRRRNLLSSGAPWCVS